MWPWSKELDCIACPKGSYRNFTAAVSNETCTECPPDTYCPLVGNALPTNCPVGRAVQVDPGLTALGFSA